MASLIPGYEYDIFISYRQKDNKHDGWVTEFVDNLKGELESTFKEEISVYFDINPHDGLLETHDVDASLKEKLKCLVFIPIISRTYCDQKSFAWEHEFRAFIEQASQDEFGLKIKLPNGNVASRVLPVRIYDLDPSDIKLCESVLGGVLRGVEFIYAEPGVNRPLKLNDDNKTNLNKTRYINQINKVANAIKEIVLSLGQNTPGQKEVIRETVKPDYVPRKNHKSAIITVAGILLTLILAGIFLIPKLVKPGKESEISIAVLPFINNSPDQENAYFINGLMDEILVNLQKIKSFDRVLPRTSTEQYIGSSRPPIRKIGKTLNVNYIVAGSGQKYGNSYRLRVSLIRAKNEKQLWAEPYEREIKETKDIYEIQSQIAQAIATELKAAVTPEEKQLIEKVPTANLIALDFYQMAREEERFTHYDIIISSSILAGIDPTAMESVYKAEKMYRTALRYDSTFAAAYTGLAGIYWAKNYFKEYFSENFMDSVHLLVNKALSFDNQLPDAYFIRGMYFSENSNYKQAFENFDKALKLNPNYWQVYFALGETEFDEDPVMAIKNYQEAASRYHGPGLSEIYNRISFVLSLTGFTELAEKYSLEAIRLEPDSTKYFFWLWMYEFDYKSSAKFFKKKYSTNPTSLTALEFLSSYFLNNGQYKEALTIFNRRLERLKTEGRETINEVQRIGYAYSKIGLKDSADYYFNKQIENCNKAIRAGRSYSSTSNYDLAGVYAFMGDKKKAFENLRIYNQKQGNNLWIRRFIKLDPLFDSIRNEPEFQNIMKSMDSKYDAVHNRMKKWLEEQGML